jgi:hypothetical protein
MLTSAANVWLGNLGGWIRSRDVADGTAMNSTVQSLWCETYMGVVCFIALRLALGPTQSPR